MSFVSLAKITNDLGSVWPRPHSMARRVLTWHLATIAALMVAICLILYFSMLREVAWVDDQLLDKRLTTMRDILRTGGDDQTFWLPHEVSEDMDGPRRMFVRVLHADNSVVIETPDMAPLAPVAMFPRLGYRPNALNSATVVGPNGKSFRVMMAWRTWVHDGVAEPVQLQLATDTSLDRRALASYRTAILLIVIAALLIGAVVGVLIMARILAPIAAIARAVGATNVSTLDTPVATTDLTDELRELVENFNATKVRLGEAYSGLRHYADNTAHELRTPLNQLLLEMEVALVKPRSCEEYQDTIANAAEACRDLSRLVDRLLFVARANNKQAVLAYEDIDLHEEMERLRNHFEASASEAGVTLQVEAAPGLIVKADKVLLLRAVANLVANAIAYAPNSEVWICAVRTSDEIYITVRDTGPGIAPEHRAHIFQRFYRADAARTSNGHVGLGLAIAKGIVELHDGTITLESKVESGTLITMRLPIDAPAHKEIPFTETV